MKKITNLLFLTVFIFICSVVIKAEVKIAFCKLESGCKFYETGYTYKQVDGMLGYLGVFERDKGIMVFFRNKQGEDVHYPDQKRTPKQLHEYFGGKGEPIIAKGGVLPFENSIQPLDGNWIVVTEAPIAKGCPEQMQSQLGGIASLKSGSKTFSKPFIPEDLLPDNTPWISTSLNKYKAFVLPKTNPSFKSIYDFNLVSPSSIKGSLTINVEIPNQPKCEIKTNFTYNRQN